VVLLAVVRMRLTLGVVVLAREFQGQGGAGPWWTNLEERRVQLDYLRGKDLGGRLTRER